MENATKALLIAAGVLITIVIVSIGILLIQNASNTSEDAKNVANAIDKATGNASSDAIGSLKQTIISKDKFNEFMNKNITLNYGNVTNFLKEVDKQNNILRDQIIVERICLYRYKSKIKKIYRK